MCFSIGYDKRYHIAKTATENGIAFKNIYIHDELLKKSYERNNILLFFTYHYKRIPHTLNRVISVANE